VIARCGQPEVSWWGWRNADDEHLVQSIARACAVDCSSRKHLANGSYINGTNGIIGTNDLVDTDFGQSTTHKHAHILTPISYTQSAEAAPSHLFVALLQTHGCAMWAYQDLCWSLLDIYYRFYLIILTVITYAEI
jgi:hypothetical protein